MLVCVFVTLSPNRRVFQLGCMFDFCFYNCKFWVVQQHDMVDDSSAHDHRLSLPVAPAGWVTRLVWPGLLVASFTANLLFAGLYVYYQWGWIAGGSAAAIVTQSLSPLWPWGGARPHRPHWLQFVEGDRLLSEEFLVRCEVWKWQLWLKQVGHESQFVRRYLAPIICTRFFFFFTVATHTHRCCSDFTQGSLALTSSPNL